MVEQAVALGAFLVAEGFDTPAAVAVARAVLHGAGLTNPRKTAIASGKLPRCRAALKALLARSCGLATCDRELASRHPAKRLVRVGRSSCEHCRGLTNRRTGIGLAARCAALGIHRILIVGGAPAGQRELQRSLAGVALDFVDGNAKKDAKQARAEMLRAEVVVIWGNTALAHSVSSLYRRPPAGVALVQVATSGAASVLLALQVHLGAYG